MKKLVFFPQDFKFSQKLFLKNIFFTIDQRQVIIILFHTQAFIIYSNITIAWSLIIIVIVFFVVTIIDQKSKIKTQTNASPF